MQDILETYGINNNSGSLELSVPPADIISGLVRLGQTCLRVADLYYTTRFIASTRFNDELEEILTDMEFDYIADDQIVGRFGNAVRVDFLVRGRKRDTAILTLPSDKYPSAARRRAEHVFAAFSDLL